VGNNTVSRMGDLNEALGLVQILALEVASEIELHYDDDEYYALGATVGNLVIARDYLNKHRVAIPPVVETVINRYHRGRN
jgi:hypothetical protein